MTKPLSLMKRLFVVGLLAILPIEAVSQPLPEPWQSRRVAANALGDKACAGDQAAIQEVRDLIRQGDPIQMNNTGWFRANCDAFKSMTKEEVGAYQQKAALAGYPIAVSNYGSRLIKGDDGVAQDQTLGITMMENALDAGYAEAGGFLARHFSDGKYLPRDPDRAQRYLERAEEIGLNPATVQQRREVIAEAREVVAQQPASDTAGAAAAPASSSEPAQYAALAVSTSDGGMGFAHDYPTEDGARDRALNECKSRGGADCAVKMVGLGKGCMAHHSAGGSATAYGWAIGPTTAMVETRAAEECRKRNDGAACGNTAWVCNDRTEAPLEVLYAAPMPSLTTGPAIQCRFYLGFQCRLPQNKAPTTFAYESFRNGAKFPVVGYNDCQTVYDTGPVLISYNNGKYARDYVAPSLQGAAKERAYGLIDKMKTYVYGKFPGCSTNDIDITFGIENPKYSAKSRYNSKESSMNYDNGTPRYHYVTLE
ncbi:DUF4189 domain-containing protein [Pseudooceanicola sp. MF1-13]|uniref:DUF4189 domain-containing protein n=1 Tax=Pseudooceanicola sp. MF1-13 TaxID=3379095 RepID=UPI0038912481